MRVPVFAASLLLTTAVLVGSGTAAVNVPLSPPAKTPVKAAKADCPCSCPPAVRPKHVSRPVKHRVARHRTRYDYASAAPVGQQASNAPWRQAPSEPYGGAGLQVDPRNLSGGVGYGAEGGGVGGAGFVDGYGQVHFATGGSVQNGPTYNSYNQSFQFNPSQPGPFQPRLMGGIAPPSANGRGR
ncbi:MAG TPA: hypothetical protein VGM26_11365 [Rhizomicrobium sp.]